LCEKAKAKAKREFTKCTIGQRKYPKKPKNPLLDVFGYVAGYDWLLGQ